MNPSCYLEQESSTGFVLVFGPDFRRVTTVLLFVKFRYFVDKDSRREVKA